MHSANGLLPAATSPQLLLLASLDTLDIAHALPALILLLLHGIYDLLLLDDLPGQRRQSSSTRSSS